MNPVSLKTSLDELHFSVRTSTVLYNANINSVEELIRHTDRDLARYRNLGKVTLREIEAKLQEHGFKLKEGHRAFSLELPPYKSYASAESELRAVLAKLPTLIFKAIEEKYDLDHS